MSSHLPALPIRLLPWSSNVLNAVHILNNLYENAYHLITSQNFNYTRLSWHLNTMYKDALPLLFQLSTSAVQESIPEDWLLKCGQHFSNLIEHIEQLMEETGEDEMYVISFIY